MPRTIEIPAADETVFVHGFEGGTIVPGSITWTEQRRNIAPNPRGVSLTGFGATPASVGLSLVTDIPGTISTGVRSTRLATGNIRLLEVLIGESMLANTAYRVILRFRSSNVTPITVNLRPNVTSATNSVTIYTGNVSSGVSTMTLNGITLGGVPNALTGIAILNSSSPVGATLDITGICVERLDTSDSTYFDGFSTSANPLQRYLWTTAPNGGHSIFETAVEISDSWVTNLEGWSGTGVQGSELAATSGSFSMLVPESATRSLTGLKIGGTYTLTGKVRAPDEATAATISVGEESSELELSVDEWADHGVTFVAGSSNMTATLSASATLLWDDITLISHLTSRTIELPEKPRGLAPEYRYFTTDLLSGTILAEVPLRGVTYECALKAAGKLSGKIPVTDDTESMNLYDSLLPGNTAIYVVRNGVCVWGGIIWDRDYDVVTRDLNISASEFTSYLYHRKIWKTWNHKFGGTLFYDSTAGWRFAFENGSNVSVKGGSTVQLDFYEPTNFKYSGFYRVRNNPKPTTDLFTLVAGSAVADLASAETYGGWTYVYTKEAHGYSTGDSVTLSWTSDGGVAIPGGSTFEKSIDVPGGPTSAWFRYIDNPVTVTLRRPIEGTVGRVLPVGTYEKVTITVRQDAYDYIHTLIDSMFEDFVGVDFPNVYIEPGISYEYPVVSKEALEGFALIETAEPHGVAPGQAIQVQDVDGLFDGEYEVTDTPADNVVVYARGGTVPLTAVEPKNVIITDVVMSAGFATLTTSAAHGFSLGQNVTVQIGDPYSVYDGTFPVLEMPSTTTFRYKTAGTQSLSATSLSSATTAVSGDPTNEVSRVDVNGNVVTLELKDPVVYSPGDSVVVANVNRNLAIIEKALDAPNSKASIKTSEPHGLSVGDTVVISGLSDYAEVAAKGTTTSTVTMTTKRPHNFRVGDSVVVGGTDIHWINNKQLTSNVATITAWSNHNTPVGAIITVQSLVDSTAISSRAIVNGVATLNTTAAHNIQVNEEVSVSGLSDTYSVISKSATRGLVTLTTSIPHNIQIGQKLVVSGVGVPFDGTTIQVQDATATRIMYNVDQAYWNAQINDAARRGQSLSVPLDVPLSKTTGTITASDSFYNGTYVVIARTSTQISYASGGLDQPLTNATGTTPVILSPSVFNGTYTVTARTATTLSYARTANNVASTVVPGIPSADVPQPLFTVPCVNSGTQVLTAVTSNTFTFAQTMPSTAYHSTDLTVRKGSVFNGTRTIATVPTLDRFTFTLSGLTANVLEEGVEKPAFAKATTLYNGTFTILSVDTVRNSITYSKTLPTYGSRSVLSRGRASVYHVLIVSTFGPFPGNADIGMGFRSRRYTGVNLEPIPYRGFELKTVGEALDAYTDNINGFEYRVDCAFDPDSNSFKKTFVMVPINFPDPPTPGTVAPLSRYGADRIVFEYPGGNITSARIRESAENAATRFFATGETDLGPEAGPNIGIASAEDLLRGTSGRKWPLLDASESVDGINNEDILHAHAERFLSEVAPPYTTLSVSLNGSIDPYVGEYKAGDWCSLIINDPFFRMRLASKLEPRTDVIVRKIASYRVSVPDGVTFPETVDLELVAEWEVDKRA